MRPFNVIEKLAQTDLAGDQVQRFFDRITAIFAQAIDARSPQQRPPGKAGLRAEKEYYRLLYLEDAFKAKVGPAADAIDPTPFQWAHLTPILGQLKDLPELQAHLVTEIDGALEAILSAAPR